MLTAWYESEFEALVDAAGTEPPQEMDEKTREQLKALGYLN